MRAAAATTAAIAPISFSRLPLVELIVPPNSLSRNGRSAFRCDPQRRRHRLVECPFYCRAQSHVPVFAAKIAGFASDYDCARCLRSHRTDQIECAHRMHSVRLEICGIRLVLIPSVVFDDVHGAGRAATLRGINKNYKLPVLHQRVSKIESADTKVLNADILRKRAFAEPAEYFDAECIVPEEDVSDACDEDPAFHFFSSSTSAVERQRFHFLGQKEEAMSGLAQLAKVVAGIVVDG